MGITGLWKGSAAGLLLGAMSVTVSHAQGSVHPIAAAALLTHMTQTNPEPPSAPPEADPAQTNDSATTKDDLFAGTERFAKGASDVTEVNMDPDSLDMVNGASGKRAKKMILNVVRSYQYDKPGMYRMEDVDEFRRKLNTGDWHCSVHTRDLKSGESTDVCNKRRTDGLVESAIITVEPKELTFIHTIRKGGNGASLNTPDLGLLMNGIGAELADLGPTLATAGPLMAALRPEINAEIKGAMAEMRAHGDEMAGMQLQLPKIEMKAFEKQMQMQEMEKQMKSPNADPRPLEKEPGRSAQPGQAPSQP